jgi:hypothetical protein
VGGGALIVAISAYYLYFVKPKTRDVEDAPIGAPVASSIVAPASSSEDAPIVAPAASSVVAPASSFRYKL